MSNPDRKLSKSALGAMEVQRSIAAGITPEVAAAMVALFRAGHTHESIAEILIPDEVEISAVVAARAVGIIVRETIDGAEHQRIRDERSRARGRALGALSADGEHGFKSLAPEAIARISALGREAMQHVFTDGQLREVWKQGGRKGGQKAAETNRANGTGVFGLSLERRRSLGSQNGTRLRDEGRGIFAPEECTPERMQAKAIRMLAATGKEPMSDQEKTRLVELAATHVRQAPPRAGTPDYPTIQKILSKEFGVERTLAALRTALYRAKKSKN